jgi:hypothetical protein
MPSSTIVLACDILRALLARPDPKKRTSWELLLPLCATSHSELGVLLQKTSELINPTEAMIKRLYVGGGTQQYSFGSDSVD